ncbi:MAG: VanZ family protein [Opitutales bacterium]
MRLPRRAWWWPVLLMIAITLVSGGNVPAVPRTPLFATDKIVHFCVFAALATAWIRCRPGGRLWPWVAWLLTTAFGLADELHQLSVPGRYFEWEDFLADSLGAAVAAALYAGWAPWRHLLELKLNSARRETGDCGKPV